VLRERRTKRFLSGAKIAMSLRARSDNPTAAEEVVAMDGIWADFPQYGGHLRGIADGSGILHVHVDPPACARHGDMLRHADKPADADFTFTALGGRPALTPERPGPQDADYTVGDDILRGLTEARELVSAGGYRVGFIAEGPEPFWLWKNGPELKPVGEGATHHLEILLLDTSSGLLVPGADVSLTLTPAAGGQPVSVPLHELMSAYQHYGETLAVAPGEYDVRVDVEPPRLELSDPRRLLQAATARFHWSVPATKEKGA
jgi:hypothetical protein